MIQLKKGVIQSVEVKRVPTTISIQSGELWLTEQGVDVLLRAGDSRQLQTGTVVWESLSELSVFCFGTENHLYRIRERHQTQRSRCGYDFGASG